jgi:hypothetical protein
VNPRSVFLGGKFAEIARARETQPVLRIVVGVEVRSANVDFPAVLDAILLSVDEFAVGLRVRKFRGIFRAARLYRLGDGKKNRNSKCDTGHQHHCCEYTFHVAPPGKSGESISGDPSRTMRFSAISFLRSTEAED